MKNEFNASDIFMWIAGRVVLFACILFLILGAAFANIFSENKSNLSVAKQNFALIFSVMLMTLGLGYLIDQYSWNPYVIVFFAAFLGMGAQKISLWMLAPWQKSEGFEDFFDRIGRIVSSFRKAWKETEKDPDKTITNEQDDDHDKTAN